MTRAGETGGVLEESLLRIADQLEKEESLRRQVKSAMAYPIVILVFAMAVMLGMVAFIVPGVRRRLRGARRRRAARDDAVRHGHLQRRHGLLVPADPRHGRRRLRLRRSGRRRPRAARIWQRFLLRVPFKIGDIFQKVALARWSRTFSALMGAGVPLLQAIDITSQTAGNIVVEEAMDERHDERQGRRHDRPAADGLARSSRRWSATWSRSARRRAP